MSASKRGPDIRARREVVVPFWNDDVQAIVDLATRWASYGEVPGEDIWVSFGIAEREFYSRLATILAQGDGHDTLDPATRRMLHQLCTIKLMKPERS